VVEEARSRGSGLLCVGLAAAAAGRRRRATAPPRSLGLPPPRAASAKHRGFLHLPQPAGAPTPSPSPARNYLLPAPRAVAPVGSGARPASQPAPRSSAEGSICSGAVGAGLLALIRRQSSRYGSGDGKAASRWRAPSQPNRSCCRRRPCCEKAGGAGFGGPPRGRRERVAGSPPWPASPHDGRVAVLHDGTHLCRAAPAPCLRRRRPDSTRGRLPITCLH
jgi:hypothetical protein